MVCKYWFNLFWWKSVYWVLFFLSHTNTLRFVDALFICLNQTCGYVDLCEEVEEIRKQPYSSENQDHEKQLLEVFINGFEISLLKSAGMINN